MVELFLGLPIFPGTSEFNQVSRITDMLGYVKPGYDADRCGDELTLSSNSGTLLCIC